MATGDAAVPLHSPPLRQSVVGLKVAARHILLPAPRAAGPAPFGRQKGAPYPFSALLYRAARTPATQLRLPESCASFRHTHVDTLSDATTTQMDPADQRAYVRGLEACLREAHRSHTRDIQCAKEAKTGQGARQRARQQGVALRLGPKPSRVAPPHFQYPGAHLQQHPHQRPPPPPYRGTLALQTGQGPLHEQIHTAQGPPLTQGQGVWHHQHHQQASADPDL